MKKSTIIVLVILSLVLLSLIAIIVIGLSGPATNIIEPGNIIAFIPLSGTIAEDIDSSVFSAGAGITPKFVRHRLEEVEDNPNVKAIILKINSPGGSVGASQEIAELIQEADKPIIVFAGDIIASGAYYIASKADRIVAKPGSLVGSIGVISQIPDLSGLYAKLGIKMQTIKSGKNKDMFGRALTPEEQKKFQALSDELYNQFVDDVAKGRQLSKKKVLQLATGEVFPATVAKKLGLVDKVGGYQTAIDEAARLAKIKNPVVQEYKPPSLIEELFDMPSINIFSLIRMQLLGRDFMLLESIRNMYTVPQYRYLGGH